MSAAACRNAVFIAVLALFGTDAPAQAQQGELVLRWEQDLRSFRGAVGRRIAVVCPPGGVPERVFGTDHYTDDSSICGAAVHAGVITADDGGPVVVVVGPARGGFKGSDRNGVASSDFGSWPGSISFDRSGEPGQIDWSTRANGIWAPVPVICPPGGVTATIWGTDDYTMDSSVCTAAAHLGIITLTEGGRVTVEPAPGLQAYAASERNGILSRDYSAWPASMRVRAGGITSATSTPEASRTPPAPTQAPPAAVEASQAPRPPMQAAPTGEVSARREGAPPTSPQTSAVSAQPPVNRASSEAAPAAPRTGAQSIVAIVPAAPSGVAVQYLSGGKIAVAWQEAAGAESYDVTYTSPNGTTAPLNTQLVTATSHVADYEVGEGTHSVRVRANSSAGMSPWSEAVTVTVPRWYGRYRVTINGFKVNHETFDNQVETDGKRDEIFVRATTQVFHNQNGTNSPAREVRTFTHGDVNAPRWLGATNPNRRMNAGSASGAGGLMTGDAYPEMLQPWQRNLNVGEGEQAFPLVVFDGDLYDDYNTAVIIPTIWEDDESEASALALAAYLQVLERVTRPIAQVHKRSIGVTDSIAARQVRQIGRIMFKRPDLVSAYADSLLAAAGVTDAVRQMASTVKSLLSSMSTGVAHVVEVAHLINNSRTRPIGLVSHRNSFSFDPAVILLTFDNAEAIIAGTAEGSMMPGIVRIDYQDDLSRWGKGDYTLFVEVRRVQ